MREVYAGTFSKKEIFNFKIEREIVKNNHTF